MITAIDNIIRIQADRNGNSRFVTHYTQWLSAEEQAGIGQHQEDRLYVLALGRALKYGGRRYRGKAYSAGIVIQAYSPSEVVSLIAHALEDLYQLRDRGYRLRSTYEGTVHVVRNGETRSEHAYAADAAAAAVADWRATSGGFPAAPAPATPTQADLAAFAVQVLEIIEDHQNVGSNRDKAPWVDTHVAFNNIASAASRLLHRNPDNGLLTSKVRDAVFAPNA